MRAASPATLVLWLCGCSWLTPTEVELPPPGPPPAAAALSVEVWRGFARLPAVAPPETLYVDLVLDVTDSMRTADSGHPLRYYGAREAAARLVERLPDEAKLDVHALGLARKRPCGDATRVASGPVSQLRGPLARKLRRLGPAGEGSLATTLTAIAGSRSAAGEETRVVAFTDLDESCGDDLCAAAELLVASGGQLELVIFGPAQPPACLAALTASPAPVAAGVEPPAHVAFRLEGLETAEALAAGRADGRVVEVPSGPAMLVLETTPPVTMGPLALEPDTRTRVRLIDFPTFQPPVREWHVDVEPMPTRPPAVLQ